MTKEELFVFSDKHPGMQWCDDIVNGAVQFRNENLFWYQADKSRSTDIKYDKLDELSADEVIDEINRGLMVEQMTRVTGYFAKINQWNGGKRAELRDRRRMNLAGVTETNTVPLAQEVAPIPVVEEKPKRVTMWELNELQALMPSYA